MKIDFRSHYSTLSYISFTVTILLYIYFFQEIDVSSQIDVQNETLKRLLVDLFLNIGIFVTVFQGLLTLYNRVLWKFMGYGEIDVSGYWKYTIQSKDGYRSGYAEIKQDMFDIVIYGFNAGSGKSSLGVGIWRSSNSYIAHKTLHYDYDLFAEKPERDFRLAKGHATVELINPKSKISIPGLSPKPVQLVGSWYDIPYSSKVASNVGSIIFERIESEKLPDLVKAQFQKSP